MKYRMMRKKNLENLYNDTFNCYVLREFNGNHLNFPGLDKKALGIEDLYSSQKNAAWRIIQNRGALVDHEVGLGKNPYHDRLRTGDEKIRYCA